MGTESRSIKRPVVIEASFFKEGENLYTINLNENSFSAQVMGDVQEGDLVVCEVMGGRVAGIVQSVPTVEDVGVEGSSLEELFSGGRTWLHARRIAMQRVHDEPTG